MANPNPISLVLFLLLPVWPKLNEVLLRRLIFQLIGQMIVQMT